MTALDLLPGARGADAPAIRCASRHIVERARQLAVLRDIGQGLLLVGIDVLSLHFQGMHVPFTTRTQSLELLAIFNLAAAAHLFLSRAWPRWRARRIAASWSAVERRKARF